MKNLKIAAILLFASMTINAQDLNQNEVPQNLQDALSSKFSDVKDVEWEKKGDRYKVEFEIDRMDHDIWYDGDGNIIKSKIEVSESELPSKIASVVKDNYADYKIESIEIIETSGIKTFKIEIEKGWSKERELIVDESGKIISDLED